MKKGLKELTEGMQRLCAVANRIVTDGEKTSRIEIDLLLENLRSLYDTALQLAESGTAAGEDDLMSSTMMATRAAMQAPEPEAPESLQVNESASLQVEESTSQQVEEPHMVEAFEGNENSLLFDEVILEPEAPESLQVNESTSQQVEEAIPEPEPEPIPEPEPEPEPTPNSALRTPNSPTPNSTHTTGQASLLDYLKEAPAARTLGETLGSPAPSNLERKVSDLRTVININDKFSFITDLFHGNMRGYNDFIMQLSETTDRATAESIVAQAAEQHKWDEESPAVKAFRKIFEKKF